MKKYFFFIAGTLLLIPIGFLLFRTTPARATPIIIQSTSLASVSIDGASSTLPDATTAGNTIIAALFTSNGNSLYYPSAVPTDSEGNTFELISATSTPDYGAYIVWAATAGSSATDTITFHDTFSDSMRAGFVMEVSGIDGAATDGVAASSCSSSPCSTASITTANSNDLVLGFFGRDTSIGFSATAPFAVVQSSTASGVEYDIQSSAGAITASASVSASAAYPVETFAIAFPPPPAPTIILDATSTAGVSCSPTCSWSHTVGSGDNSILVLTAPNGGWNGSTCTPTCIHSVASATYDGIPLTFAVGVYGGAYTRSEIWYLVNPPSGTHTIAVTMETSTDAHGYRFGAESFFGVNQTDPIDATSSNITSDGTATVTITPANDNDLVVDAFEWQNVNYLPTLGALQHLLWEAPKYSDGDGASYINVPHASSQTFTWSGDPANNSTVDAAISLRPAPVYTTATWIATSSDEWSAAGNWSTGVAPTSLQTAIFSASSTVDCVIDQAIDVAGIEIDTGFSGTVTQSSTYAIVLGTKGYLQSAGTFSGGSGNITVGGDFTVNAGATFTSTSGELAFEGSASFLGTFNHNSGMVQFEMPTVASAITGSSTFYQATFGGLSAGSNVGVTIATSTVLTVQKDLSLQANSSSIQLAGGGEIDVQGDIDGGTSAVSTSGTATIALTGTSTQMIGNDSGNGSSLYLPNLAVNKSAGLAVVTSSPVITGSLTVTSGELRLSSSTTAQTVEIDGPVTVDTGARLSDYNAVSSTIELGSTITNNGVIWFDGTGNGCVTPLPNFVILRSTEAGTARSWSGSGTFIIRGVDAKDQTGSAAVTILNGLDSGNNGSNWTFTTGAPSQLVQSTSTADDVDTSLSASLGFLPREGDLIVVAVSDKDSSMQAPTDNNGNTYTLVASSTFGNSSSYGLNLYYAKDIAVTSSSFRVQIHGTSTSGGFASTAIFDYTGMSPSTTLDESYSANTDTSGNATALTSGSATGGATNELYFGAMTFDADTTATTGSGWTTELSVPGDAGDQSLYTEDLASINPLTTAATWTSNASTSYAAVLGIFRSPPRTTSYPISGTLDSATFDTQAVGGAQLNSVLWQGTQPAGTKVEFQFAVSDSPTPGTWNFWGPDGTSNTYFIAAAGVPAKLLSTTNGYGLFNGYRYFRYRVTLFSDTEQQYTPTVTNVTVNWSP